MSKQRRIVLIVTAITLLLMLLFPPFQLILHRGTLNKGYGFILEPPDARATVNTTLLVVQWLAIILVGAVAWLLSEDREQKHPDVVELTDAVDEQPRMPIAQFDSRRQSSKKQR